MSDKIEKLLDKAESQAAASDGAMSSRVSARRDFENASETEKHFALYKSKLFEINRWNSHAALTSFALFDETGVECDREIAAVGDFIRLTLIASGKSDWVKITRIIDEPRETIITVQPSRDPTDADETATSHFFTGESTNNFCLQTDETAINFYVVGLNERTITRNTKNMLETVRNAAVANLGHYLGIQKLEWKQFCERFLENL